MKTNYYFSSCPNCTGGLYICKDITHQKLFFHCEECEADWDSPNDIEKGNCYVREYLESEVNQYPTAEEIIEGNWSDILRNCRIIVSEKGMLGPYK